jgi:hypothetical protein
VLKEQKAPSKLRLCFCCTRLGFNLPSIVTQLAASTPPIKDSEGNKVEGSIAELRKISLNGRTQWISIRGRDKTKPVLLFLAAAGREPDGSCPP